MTNTGTTLWHGWTLRVMENLHCDSQASFSQELLTLISLSFPQRPASILNEQLGLINLGLTHYVVSVPRLSSVFPGRCVRLFSPCFSVVSLRKILLLCSSRPCETMLLSSYFLYIQHKIVCHLSPLSFLSEIEIRLCCRYLVFQLLQNEISNNQ
jgi:hypothetical protein